DGIRDFHVTGVQTCALPISIPPFAHLDPPEASHFADASSREMLCGSIEFTQRGILLSTAYIRVAGASFTLFATFHAAFNGLSQRSEERRVGKAYNLSVTTYQ